MSRGPMQAVDRRVANMGGWRSERDRLAAHK